MEINMANSKMTISIEKLIEEHETLHKFIVNDGSIKFKKGDIVKCSYIKDKFYEVLQTKTDRVILYDLNKRSNANIGNKFIEKVRVNKKTMEILYKS